MTAAKGLTQALARAIVNVVKNDSESQKRITWNIFRDRWALKGHWVGSIRNALMQTQTRLDKNGPPVVRNMMQRPPPNTPVSPYTSQVARHNTLVALGNLLMEEVSISPERERYTCIGISTVTSEAIRKALIRDPLLKHYVEDSGTVSCRSFSFPHQGTGILFKPAYSRIRHGVKPNHRKVNESVWDVVFDWWYSLDIENPRIFFSQEEFDAYSDLGVVRGLDHLEYLQEKANSARPRNMP